MEIKKRINYEYKTNRHTVIYEVWFKQKYKGSFPNLREAKEFINQLFTLEVK